MKEPGQLIYELGWPGLCPWDEVSDSAKVNFAAIEAAVLAPAQARIAALTEALTGSAIEAAFMAGRHSMFGTDRHHADRALQSYRNRARAALSQNGFNEPEPHTPQYPYLIKLPEWDK